jgi:hypothetical protein
MEQMTATVCSYDLHTTPLRENQFDVAPNGAVR